MSDEDTLENVIVNLRSVLISEQQGLSTKRLLHDYEEFLFAPLPFRRLGFRTAEDLLHSIPHVVYRDRETGYWKGVADENTVHIKEMVSRQRPKSSRNRPSFAGTRGMPPSYMYQTYNRTPSLLPARYPQSQLLPLKVQSVPLFPYRVQPAPYFPPRAQTSYAAPQAPRIKIDTTRFQREFNNIVPQPKAKLVPAPLKGQIEEMLATYPSGIAMSEFADAFKARYHKMLNPADFGYININDFVLGMPETIRVRNTGREMLLMGANIPDSNMKKTEFNFDQGWRNASSAVSNYMEKKQTVSNNTKSNGWSNQQNQKYEMPKSRVEAKDEKKDDCKNNLGFSREIQHDYKPNLTSNSTIKQVVTENKSHDLKENKIIRYLDSEEKENVNSNTNTDAHKQVDAFARQKKPWVDNDIEDDQNCAVSKRLKFEFRQLLEKYPKEIKSNFLPKYYEKEFNKELDYQGLGYISLSDLIFDIPDIFFPYRESPNSDYLLLDARACKQYGCPSYTAQGCRTKKIPEVIKKSIVKLLYKNPKGILVHNFREEYKKDLSRELPYEDYGFYNTRDFLDELANDTIELDDTINGALVRLRPDSLHKYLPALGGRPEMAIRNLLPNDFVKFGEDIPLQALPENSTEKYFEVIPSEILSPDEFYFYLRGQETSIALENLMNSLEFYHLKDGSDYIVPSEHYKIGQIAAGLYDNKDWHRVKILKVHDDDVMVFYIDYGTIGKVLKSNMRLLKRRFATLPAQAIEAKLWDVKPVLPEWTDTGRRRFYEIVDNKTLTAKVIGRKTKPISKAVVIGLWLVDTLKPGIKEFHINNVLVQEGHAVYFDETRELASSGDVSAQYQSLNLCNPSSLFPMPSILEMQAAYVNNMCAMNSWMYNCNQMLPQIYYQSQQDQKTQTATVTTMTQPESATKLVVSEKKASQAVKCETEVAKRVQSEPEVVKIVKEPAVVRNNSGLDNLDDLLEELSVKRFVKVVMICSHAVHLILFNKELYIMAKEISQFLWPRDLLRIKLRLHHLKIPKVMINEEDYPELFSELFSYDVCEAPLEPGQPHAVNIYPFNRVPEIIDKFNAGLIELKEAVVQELDRFDPNDTYWGNSDDGISVGEPWDLLDEVELGLEVIKARKTAIERELLGGIKQQLVDELNFLKGRILLLESGKFK